MSSQPLGAQDVYLYLHGNGAVSLVPPDQRSRFVTLADAIDAAMACHDDGGQVHLGWDRSGLGPAAHERLAQLGVRVVPVDLPPPYSWGEGTTALISAAAFGRDAILDDLLDRGADLHAADDTGSTALHHAAGAGNLHAIDALVRAGAEIDRVSAKGFRPRDIALARGETAAAQRLEELGADAALGPQEEIRFSRSHYWTMWIWPLIAIVSIGVALPVLWPLALVELGALALVAALYSSVLPPRAFWSGGVPRRLRGSELVIRRMTGREDTIDLQDVVLAGAGGVTHRFGYGGGRWILLAHRAGHPTGSTRELRRLSVSADDEVTALADVDAPLLVVPLDGFRRNEVILPLGNLLTVHGVRILPSLSRQLARARTQAAERSRSGSTD